MELIFDNPIVRREIRARMRGNRALLLQLAYLGVLTAVIIGVYLTSSRADSASGELGRTLFVSLTVAQGILIALIAPALSAGAVSGEREQQTLEAVFCTPLGTGAIFRGKLVACTLFLGLLLTLGLPLMAICLMLGGVGAQELVGAYAVQGATALLLAAVGLGWSLVCTGTTLATTATYLTVVGYLLLTVAFANDGTWLAAMCAPMAYAKAEETTTLLGAAVPMWVPATLVILLIAAWVLDVSAAHARLLRDGRVSVRPRLWLLGSCLTLFGVATCHAPNPNDLLGAATAALVILLLATPILVAHDGTVEERRTAPWWAWWRHSPRSAPAFMVVWPATLLPLAVVSDWRLFPALLVLGLAALVASQVTLLLSRAVGRRWPALWLSLLVLAGVHGYLAALLSDPGMAGDLGWCQASFSPYAALLRITGSGQELPALRWLVLLQVLLSGGLALALKLQQPYLAKRGRRRGG